MTWPDLVSIVFLGIPFFMTLGFLSLIFTPTMTEEKRQETLNKFSKMRAEEREQKRALETKSNPATSGGDNSMTEMIVTGAAVGALLVNENKGDDYDSEIDNGTDDDRVDNDDFYDDFYDDFHFLF